jgi:hypothetical protein
MRIYFPFLIFIHFSFLPCFTGQYHQYNVQSNNGSHPCLLLYLRKNISISLWLAFAIHFVSFFVNTFVAGWWGQSTQTHLRSRNKIAVAVLLMGRMGPVRNVLNTPKLIAEPELWLSPRFPPGVLPLACISNLGLINFDQSPWCRGPHARVSWAAIVFLKSASSSNHQLCQSSTYVPFLEERGSTKGASGKSGCEVQGGCVGPKAGLHPGVLTVDRKLMSCLHWSNTTATSVIFRMGVGLQPSSLGGSERESLISTIRQADLCPAYSSPVWELRITALHFPAFNFLCLKYPTIKI